MMERVPAGYLLPWRASLGLAGKELRQNIGVFLFPAILCAPLLIYRIAHGHAFALGANATAALIVLAAITAIVYGFQGFAGESDRRTLDFLLSRPVSPLMLILAKYLTSVFVYLFWLAACQALLRIDLTKLLVVKGMGPGWVILTLLVLESMGFLSGLLSRGAERLAVAALLTAAAGGLCYGAWSPVFTLMTARYTWYDIPPHLYTFVTAAVPLALLLCALPLPLIYALWWLRGRPRPDRFRPVRRALLLWLVLYAAVMVARAELGPAVWPLRLEALGGDWHPRGGIVIAGASQYLLGRTPDLYLCRPGGWARPIYHGLDVRSPRWSPDGKAIAFTDADWVMIWRGGKTRRLARGAYPYWALDGGSLALAALPPKSRGAKQAYPTEEIRSVNVVTGTTRILWRNRGGTLLGFAWDSARNRLYLLDRKNNALADIDLRTGKTITIPVSTPPVLSMQNPWPELDGQGRLLLSTAYEHTVQIYLHQPGTDGLATLIERAGQNISPLSQAILSPDGQSYLWPRIDGAYEYEGFVPPHEHHAGE